MAKVKAKTKGSAKTKNVGRKTDYNPDYIELVIDYLSKGKTLESFAGVIRVSRTTLYNWRKLYPEFDEAVDIGQSAALAKWEDLLIANAEEGTGSSATCIYGTKNRSRDGSWRDKVEVEQKTTHIVQNADALADLLKD